MAWYAVRSILRTDDPDVVGRSLFEERITLWRADSFESAIELAKREAAVQAEAVDSQCLDFAQAFQLFDEEIASGTEVFSLIRISSLAPDSYLDRFFDTGAEVQQTDDKA